VLTIEHQVDDAQILAGHRIDQRSFERRFHGQREDCTACISGL
jgi:hypothetical protein